MKPAEADLYRDTLAASVPFQGLDQDSLDNILKHGMLLEAKKDDLVFYEKMRGGLGLYVILEGDIEIFRSASMVDGEQDSEPVHLATLEAGECFGEYSLIDGQTTSAAAKAVRNSKLFLLARGEFQRAIDASPEAGKVIYRNLLQYLIGRLRKHG